MRFSSAPPALGFASARRITPSPISESLPVPVPAPEKPNGGIAKTAAVSKERLGIAVLHEKIGPLVTALESNGIAIEWIIPATLLAVQDFLNEKTRKQTPAAPGIPSASVHGPDPLDAIIWAAGPKSTPDQAIEYITLSSSIPTSWRIVSDAKVDLRRTLTAATFNRPDTLRTVLNGASDAVANQLKWFSNVKMTMQRIDLEVAVAATRGAKAIVEGTLHPWINLRRDALATADPIRQIRNPLLAAVASLALLMIVLTGSMIYRAAQYDELARQHRESAAASFRKIYPSQPVPIGVRSRLESEERRLRGLAGDSSELDQLNASLSLLKLSLGRFPGDLRFRLLEFRLDPQQIYLEGQARTHGDADSIAASLRKGRIFLVDQPRTENLTDRGVSFTLSGTVVPLSERIDSSEAESKTAADAGAPGGRSGSAGGTP